MAYPKTFSRTSWIYEVERLYREALRRLEELGAELRPIRIPGVESFPPMAARIMFADAAHYHRKRMSENMAGFGPIEQQRFRQGAAWSGVELIDAMRVRDRVKRAFAEAAQEVNVVAVATNPVTAPLIGAAETVCRGETEPTGDIVVRHTRLGTFAGIPAMSIPMGLTDDGLPAGLMLMSRAGHDINVLSVGWAYEQSFPFVFRKF